MKYSQYNFLVPYEGNKWVLYNAFQQKLIFLEETLKDILEKYKKFDIDHLQDVHSDFYNYLVETKFLVADNVDELEEVKQLCYKVDNNPEIFLLTINPTLNCNFKCWYCYESHIKNSKLKDLTIVAIKKFITNIAEKKEIKQFNISFFGGEPLLYFKKNIIPIIDHFVEKCSEKNINFGISFTTNGYLINEAFIDYFKEKNLRPHFQITFDGYKEEHDKVRFVSENRGSYEVIVQNIKALLQNGCNITARINYTDENIHNCFKIVDDFDDISQEARENLLRFDFHRVWQNDKPDDTSNIMEENAQKMRAKGFRTSMQNSTLNNVVNSCYADKRNGVLINYNGDIYKCTARDFLSENRNGYLSENGELIWENDHLEKRMNAKFHNKPCLSCNILPLCNGGCSQHAFENLETGTEYCIYGENPKTEIKKIIRTKIEDIINAPLQEA